MNKINNMNKINKVKFNIFKEIIHINNININDKEYKLLWWTDLEIKNMKKNYILKIKKLLKKYKNMDIKNAKKIATQSFN